jgi:methyl-accepting chemotaxis protein
VKREGNRRKLKNLIVNKKQLILVVISTIYFFLSVIVTLTAIIAPVYSDIFQSNDAVAQREAAKLFILLSEKLGIALSAIFLITITSLVWGTHRFFGPLINFLKIFKRVAGGDLTARVILRRGDLLKSEACTANEMIQSLAMTISDVKQQNDLLVTALNGIVEGRCPKSGTDDEILEAHNQARTCEALLAKLVTTEMSGNGQIPGESPEISCPKSFSSKDLKDLDPGVME